MSPTDWQIWHFGVLLAFAVLGLGVAAKNWAVLITAIIILLFLYRFHHKDQQPKKVKKW